MPSSLRPAAQCQPKRPARVSNSRQHQCGAFSKPRAPAARLQTATTPGSGMMVAGPTRADKDKKKDQKSRQTQAGIGHSAPTHRGGHVQNKKWECWGLILLNEWTCGYSVAPQPALPVCAPAANAAAAAAVPKLRTQHCALHACDRSGAPRRRVRVRAVHRRLSSLSMSLPGTSEQTPLLE